MEDGRQFLYRGTTTGWPGSDAARRERRVSATFDPLVATLFAIHGLNYGRGVVHVASITDLPLIEEDNVFAEIEREVIVGMTPQEFTSVAVATLTAAESRGILAEIGFRLPPRIGATYTHLSSALVESRDRGDRLRRDQVAEFDRRALALQRERS